MDFIDIPKMRATIQQFDKRYVKQEKIEKILEAIRWLSTAVDASTSVDFDTEYTEKLTKVREFYLLGYNQKYVDLAKECSDKEHSKKTIIITAYPLCYLSVTIKTLAESTRKMGKPAA